MKEPQRGKKMVITIDIDSGHVESVTNDKNEDAFTEKSPELNGSKVVDAPNYTFIRTHSSPGCAWYYYNRNWYWI
jgi:hypothetical protein